MRRLDVISEICTTMVQLGWGPYQNDHEDANGQFEINWSFNDALTTADQLAFFKFMVKSIAEKHGLRATFMPKPFVNLTGNGCHVHLSVWDKEGKTNLFHDSKDEMGLSKTAYNFLGGLIHHADSLVAITNPTVNSYKRINAPRTISGATWSPNTVTFGGNNRTHMVRIPDEGRTEFRLPDGAANPYLMMAGILAAGLHGLDEKMDPGKRLDIDMYAEGHTVKNAKKLPLNLLDALRNFEKNTYLREALGEEVCAAYLKLKHNEWNQFCRHLTQWERDTTLDC
jgi:glutamine synthetase